MFVFALSMEDLCIKRKRRNLFLLCFVINQIFHCQCKNKHAPSAWWINDGVSFVASPLLFFHPPLSILILMRFVPHQRCVYFRPYNCFCYNNNKFEQVFLLYPYTRSVKVQWRVFEKLFTDFRDCFDRVDYYDLLACAKSRFQPIPSVWLGY